ncbi:response regulator [Ideonella sp.]|uniref:response regulator n=1 Tax=Ideonella sp. TaxID=1929293 RepID=UPI0035B41B08
MARTVLIVEDDQRIRRGFELAIRATVDLRVAGVAADLPEARELFDATEPDVLLVDLGLPSGSGIELIRHAQATRPACESMVVTVFADEQAVLSCIEAGATGYLLKDARPVNIVEQIRLLCAGGSPISPTVARRLMLRIGALASPQASAGLVSTQERQVLVLSAKGYGYEEVAGLMGLSRHTVETYVKRIYRKLQVHSKTEAVYEARKLGIVHD